MSQTNTTEDTRIQWHPAFVTAMNLEFRQNKNELIYGSPHFPGNRRSRIYQRFWRGREYFVRRWIKNMQTRFCRSV